MNHARDDVFARSTLSLDEYGNIRARQFCQAVPDGLHAFRAPEHNGIGRHFPQGLNERTDTTGCHGWFLSMGGDSLTCTRRAKAFPVRSGTTQI